MLINTNTDNTGMPGLTLPCKQGSVKPGIPVLSVLVFMSMFGSGVDYLLVLAS